MIRFLKAAQARTATAADVDKLLAMRGTKLIIQQQNISRTVSEQQYREILLALINGREPELKPFNDDQRSRNGIKGLLQDDFPALAWGMSHTELLESRLAEIRKIDVANRAKAIALANLPDPVSFDSRLYVVMGGRAGAAALGDEIYFDALITSFRADKGFGSFPKPDEVLEFFAHEMHHVGLGKIMDAKYKSLKLNDSEARGFGFLNSLVTEGTATFMINGHKRLGELREDKQYRENFEQLPKLLLAVRTILESAVSGRLSEEQYDAEAAAFLGSGYHVTGAAIVSKIFEVNGADAVWSVMRDPRLLPLEYDRAATGKLRSNSHDDGHFGRRLSESVRRMGD